MRKPKDDTDRATLTVVGAARFINMSVPYLRSSMRTGNGPPFVKLGRAVRYRRADLEAWLAASTVRPAGEARHA